MGVGRDNSNFARSMVGVCLSPPFRCAWFIGASITVHISHPFNNFKPYSHHPPPPPCVLAVTLTLSLKVAPRTLTITVAPSRAHTLIVTLALARTPI